MAKNSPIRSGETEERHGESTWDVGYTDIHDVRHEVMEKVEVHCIRKTLVVAGMPRKEVASEILVALEKIAVAEKMEIMEV